MPFEILNRAFVLLRRSLAVERAEIFSFARSRIFLAGIQPIFAGFQFPNHKDSLGAFVTFRQISRGTQRCTTVTFSNETDKATALCRGKHTEIASQWGRWFPRLVRSLGVSLVDDYCSSGFNSCLRVEHPFTTALYCYEYSVARTLLASIRTADFYANSFGSNGVDLRQPMIELMIISYREA